MKAFIVQFPFGVAAFDEKNDLVEKALFQKKQRQQLKVCLEPKRANYPNKQTLLSAYSLRQVMAPLSSRTRRCQWKRRNGLKLPLKSLNPPK